MGDVRSQTFKEIWDNALFDTLSDRDDRGDHCGVCDYRHYCGGCRARAVSYTGDIQAGDPGCVYNIHLWDDITTSQKGQLVVLGQNSFPDNLLAGMTDGRLPSQKESPDILLSQLNTVIDDVVGQRALSGVEGQQGLGAQGDD